MVAHPGPEKNRMGKHLRQVNPADPEEILPGNHHLLLQSLQDPARSLEPGEVEMRHLERGLQGLLDGKGTETPRDIGFVHPIAPSPAEDPRLLVPADGVHEAIQGRKLVGEGNQGAGQGEIETAVPPFLEGSPGIRRSMHFHGRFDSSLG